jgi:periplasmic protein TonB
VIAGIHALALWGLATRVVRREPLADPAPLFVQWVEQAPAPAATPEPLRVPPPLPQAPLVVLPLIPAEVPTPPTRPAPAAIEMAAPVEEARPAAATAAAPSVPPSAPPPLRPATLERQIAITQVEYLTPPVLLYPLAARRAREQGQVQVRVRVDEQGRPERWLVVRPSGSNRLDEAAVATVRATRFKPYTENGVPQPFWVLMPLVFELEG